VKIVYPIPGRFVPGVPAVEQRVSDELAAALITHGAFTDDPPPAGAEPTEPEDPPTGGSSESEE